MSIDEDINCEYVLEDYKEYVDGLFYNELPENITFKQDYIEDKKSKKKLLDLYKKAIVSLSKEALSVDELYTFFNNNEISYDNFKYSELITFSLLMSNWITSHNYKDEELDIYFKTVSSYEYTKKIVDEIKTNPKYSKKLLDKIITFPRYKKYILKNIHKLIDIFDLQDDRYITFFEENKLFYFSLIF